MLTLPSKVRVFLWTKPVDMRKGFQGLSDLARQNHGIFEGDLFVFVGRRRDRCKVLFWERGGFVLVYERLERRFKLPEQCFGGLVSDGENISCTRRSSASCANRAALLRRKRSAQSTQVATAAE